MVPGRSPNIRNSTRTSTKIKNNRRKKPVPRIQREKSRKQVTSGKPVSRVVSFFFFSFFVLIVFSVIWYTSQLQRGRLNLPSRLPARRLLPRRHNNRRKAQTMRKFTGNLREKEQKIQMNISRKRQNLRNRTLFLKIRTH